MIDEAERLLGAVTSTPGIQHFWIARAAISPADGEPDVAYEQIIPIFPFVSRERLSLDRARPLLVVASHLTAQKRSSADKGMQLLGEPRKPRPNSAELCRRGVGTATSSSTVHPKPCFSHERIDRFVSLSTTGPRGRRAFRVLTDR